MSEYDSIYRVITPIGVFEAVFGEEDAPIEYRGDKVAILFFKNWLSINQISGDHGILLNEQNLTPNELYGFCQPGGSGITVIPPLDDMLAFAEQESMDQDEEQSKTEETNNMQDAMTMDAVSGVEKIELIKELSGIRSSLQSVESGIEKLSLVKRIKEIRELIGIKDPRQFGTENRELVSPPPGPEELVIAKQATIEDVNKAEFSVGDTVYMQDVTDENKRIPVNFRGYLNDSQSIVAWNGSQMTVETNRLFKDDIHSSTESKDSIKSAFIAELEALKSETDINIFNAKLDDIAARIEQAGLMEALDAELNATADVLTRLLAAAEKAQ